MTIESHNAEIQRQIEAEKLRTGFAWKTVKPSATYGGHLDLKVFYQVQRLRRLEEAMWEAKIKA